MDKKSVKQVAVVVLVNEHDEVLILKRSEEVRSWQGMWNFPGGSVDSGETKESAASRELMEEAGISTNPGSLCPIGVLYTQDNKEINVFFTKYCSEKVDINWESSDFKWVSPDHLEDYYFVGGEKIQADLLQAIKNKVTLHREIVDKIHKILNPYDQE